MTATYTNQPGTRNIDTVRFEIDDRDCTPETDAVLTDEEIQYLIDSNHHILLAAAAAADAVAAKYAADVETKQVGDLRISYGSGGNAASYESLASTLRARAARKAVPYVGGMSHAEKTTVKKDTDRVLLEVEVGMDDNETAGTATDRGVMDY